VTIEYDPEDVEVFIAAADAIEAAFPSVVVEGNEQGDGRPGSFEVQTSDGMLVFSRLSSKQAPDPDVLVHNIANRARLSQEASQDGPACG